jgi:hypothetical protein
MLNRGADLSQVQDILGHASPATTKLVYAHYDSAWLRAAFDRSNVTLEELAAEQSQDERGPGHPTAPVAHDDEEQDLRPLRRPQPARRRPSERSWLPNQPQEGQQYVPTSLPPRQLPERSEEPALSLSKGS